MNKILAFLLAVGGLPLAAQSNFHDSRTPRTKDGKPNLAAPVPRLQGKPDLSGVWQAERAPERETATLFGDDFPRLQIDPQDFNKNVITVFAGLKPEEVPLRPEGVAALKRLQAIPDQWPHTQCLPAGIPGDMLVLALKLIQTPREIVMLTEIASPPRRIHTDGRPLPKDPDPSWMGYSIGKWEGDTLVVETVGLKEGWLDGFGHPRSERMRITERYHRRDFGHMVLEFTFNDPKYYTKPFGLKTALELVPDSDLLEYVCLENERDRAHLGK